MKFDFQKLIEAFGEANEIIHGKVIYDYDEQYQLMEECFYREIISRSKGFEYMNA